MLENNITTTELFYYALFYIKLIICVIQKYHTNNQFYIKLKTVKKQTTTIQKKTKTKYAPLAAVIYLKS